MKRIFAVCAILLSTVGAAFLTSAFAAEPEPAFPVERMQRDWLYQDAGTLKVDGFFTSAESCAEEKKLVDKVLEELDGSDAEEIRRRADELASAPGNDPRWKELYFDACRIRRAARLAYFDDAPREYVYAKHFVFGDCQAMFAMTDHLTDAIFREKGDDYRMGSQLRILRIGTNGDTSSELLLDCPEGIVRDPAVSWDGKTLAFSMRRNDADDDFHLYTMNLETREITQITFGLGIADMDPDWLPNGDLIFTSTRCNFSAPCWWSSVCNLYTCDAQGRFIRRLGVDHGHTVFPHITNDGRVIYTRWEYSDRHAGYLHSLFVMNADGTNQTEYYGNNSQYPSAILHARAVPDSTKVFAISGAHHIDQRGKLIEIDRSHGTNAGEGINYLAPVKPVENMEGQGTRGDIVHGTDGEQFQYPTPLDEENLIVGYLPEGGGIRALKGIKDGRQGGQPFGLYWFDRDGRRELLAFDPVVSVCQAVPLCERDAPQTRKSTVDESKDSGLFYVQDVYYGPPIAGVKRGDIKKLRVVALDYRAKGTVALGLHPWGGHQTSPCALNNGSYDVKHVLGTVDVEEDGSCYFECPSRVPVFFQLLDEKGRMIQNMRSWTLVLPGETFACIGCHEDKNESIGADATGTNASIAASKPPQKIKPFFEPGDEPVQEMERYLTDSEKAAIKYLGSNAPQADDVPMGFSYTREVQPIWDEHCICCHAGEKNPDKKDVPLSLLGDERPVTNGEIYDRTKWRIMIRPYKGGVTQGTPGRKFSESYLYLTDFGYNAKIPDGLQTDIAHASYDSAYLSYFGGKAENVPNPNKTGYDSSEYDGSGIINWLHVSSICGMLPPYSYGSTSSRLMNYLEPTHYGVQLTAKEKETVACWIDLNVPYTGSWLELNDWDRLVHNIHSGLTPWYVYRDKMRQIYLYFEAKRLREAELEIAAIDKYRRAANGETFTRADFPVSELGGQQAQKEFVEAFDRLPQTVPIYGLAEGKDSRGGTNVQGNPVRNLAVNPDAFTCSVRSYPRVVSNSWYRYRPEFSPINAIDGTAGGEKYWRPAKRTDLWLSVEFGRIVTVEKVVITLKLAPGQKKTWTKAALQFDDGSKVPITLKLTEEPQEFAIPKRTTAAVKLTELVETFPLENNGVQEIEVWGRDIQ